MRDSVVISKDAMMLKTKNTLQSRTQRVTLLTFLTSPPPHNDPALSSGPVHWPTHYSHTHTTRTHYSGHAATNRVQYEVIIHLL